MGFFDTVGGIFNGNNPLDELSTKVTDAIDGVQATLENTSQATEGGIQKVQDATQKVEDMVPGNKN